MDPNANPPDAAPDADADRQLAGLAGLVVPVSRDDAAHAAGISRPLAAYHLDRLVADGLLHASYQRRGGRRGPGAGRPAKHYARAARQIELSLPARDYAALAQLLARAVEADPCGAARAALDRAAGAPGGAIRLRNCPFDRIAADHRELVCGANLAMFGALSRQLGGDPPVRAVLDPRPGRCCVALTRDG